MSAPLLCISALNENTLQVHTILMVNSASTAACMAVGSGSDSNQCIRQLQQAFTAADRRQLFLNIDTPILALVTWYQWLHCTSELVSAACAVSCLHMLPAETPTILSCRKLQCEATVTAKVYTRCVTLSQQNVPENAQLLQSLWQPWLKHTSVLV